MKAGPLDPKWEATKEEAKKLIAAGGCSAIKYWSNTDAIRLCPEEHKKEVHFEALECMVYISEWEDAANKAIELINRGLSLIKSKKKHPPASPPSPAIEGKEEDGGKWQRLSDTLLKRSDWAHAIGAEKGQYYSGLSDGLAQAVRQMESLLEDKIEPPTPPAGAKDTYTREEVKLILSQRESYFQNHNKGEVFLTTGQWLDKNYTPGLHLLTQPAGAEGEQTMEELEKEYDVLESINYKATKKIITLENELSAAQARIAELEQTIREQKEWINSHL